MADDVKRLLIKLGIDGSDALAMIAKLQDSLDRLYQAEKAKTTERKVAQRDDAAAMQKQAEMARQQTAVSAQHVENLRKQIAAKQTTVKAIQEEIRNERVGLDIRQTTLRVMQAEGTLSGVALKTMEKQISLERQRLNLQQAQLRATGLSAAAGERRGGLGGLLQSASRGLFGGGLTGGIATGLLGGIGVAEGISLISEKMRELYQELVHASGSAQNLRLEFEKLASRKGNDPAEMLERMRIATKGLVADSQLFQTANVFMRSNMKLTSDQMLKLISTTVDLARLNGKTAPEAMNAINIAFERGRPALLARIAGLTTLQRQMTQMPRGIDPAIASTIQFNTVLKALEEAAAKGVKPMTTLPELMMQFKVASTDFIEAVAEGVLSTGKFGKTIADISTSLSAALPKILEFGKEVGKKLADALSWLWEHRTEIEVVIGLITFTNLGSRALTGAAALIEAWGSVRKAVMAAAEAVGIFRTAEVGAAVGGVAAGAGGATGVAAGAVGAASIPVLAAAAAAVLGYMLGYYADQIWSMAKNIARVSIGMAPEYKHSGVGEAEDIHGNVVKASPFSTAGFYEQQRFGAGGKGKDWVGDLLSQLSPQVGSKFTDTASIKREALIGTQIRREQAKIELQIAKDEIAAEQDLLKSRYEMGLVELTDYLDKETALRKREHDARAEEIRLEGESQKAAARIKVQPTVTPTGEVVPVSAEALAAERKQEELIDSQTRLKLMGNDANFERQRVANQQKFYEDRLGAEKVYESALMAIQKQGLAEQQTLLEKRFGQGSIDADQYLNARRSLIQQEQALVAQELQHELDDVTKNEKDKAAIRVKGIESEIAAQKQLTDLDEQQDQIRVKALENSYSRIRTDLQARQAIAQLNQQQRVPGARGEEANIIEEMVKANQRYIDQLTQEAQTLHSQPELWAQTVDKIKQAVDQQIKLNEQLIQAKSIAGPLASLFGAVAQSLSGIKGGGAAAAVFDSMAKSMGAIFEFEKKGGPSGGLIGSIFGKGRGAKQVGPDALGDSATKASATLDRYTATVQADEAKLRALVEEEHQSRMASQTHMASDLAGIINTFKSAMDQASAAALKFAGAADQGPGQKPEEGPPSPEDVMKGMPPGLGPQLGAPSGMPTQGSSGKSGDLGIISKFTSMLKGANGGLKDFLGGLTGAVSSIGNFVGALSNAQSGAGGALSGGMAGLQMGMQLGGPIGGVIGGIGGAVAGGILGSKEEAMKHNVKVIQDQLANIVEQLNQGTISIAQAIANLRQERQTAIGLLSGGKGSKGKKGQPSQLQQVLQQIDQEMQQLINEQKQLLDNMDQSILQMSQGIYWQPVISQLDQIVKQYQMFASAAQGNTQQVAAANEYLTQSLQNYSQTMEQTFLSDQEQAIQNALQLLQLERQQAQLANQYQSQVYGILTQGVTSRQVSGAQTKGAEIEALNQQYSMQQHQMQQEIAVAKYKYMIQQKIFGLASDQVGLEMEMVAVQDAQTNQSMQGVLVLQQAIEAINAALASGTLPSLLTGATSTGAQGLAGILQLLGLQVPNVPGLGVAGGINYLGEIPGQYQGVVNFLNQIDPNFMLDVLQAMMTAPGSNARQALLALINNPQFGLATDAKNSGYDFNAFLNWISTGTALPAGQPLPPPQPGGYAEGTTNVPQTGIATLEKGEAVIPAQFNPWSTNDASGGMPFLAGVAQQALSDSHLQVEQQIYKMVMDRVSAEWQLVQAKMQLLQYESSSNAGVTSFEAGLQKVYENRGRYGAGAVRTEFL